MIHFKDNNKNKSALSTRWAQMSKQEQIIEKKKMEIQNKLEAQKQAAALAAQAKLSNPTSNDDNNSNIFSNDGSFMSQFKALLEKQTQDKKDIEDKEQQLKEATKVKQQESKDAETVVHANKSSGRDESNKDFNDRNDRKRSDPRNSRDKNRRWNDRGRNRIQSPSTPIIEDRKMTSDKSIPSLMQIPFKPPSEPDSNDQWDQDNMGMTPMNQGANMEGGPNMGPGPNFGPGFMGPMGPGPMGPGPMGPGPMGPGPMGPGPMGPGPMGPGPMGPGPMGPGPMGPGPMGPGPMGPGPMGPGPMGPGPMGPGPMGPGPMGPGPMGPGPMGPGPMGPGPMGLRPNMGPGPGMGPPNMGSGPMMGMGGPNMPRMPPGGPGGPPFMNGPPNFPMPPNFMGPNGPGGPNGPMPPNMCGPNGPMPPFFRPPFPNPMMGPNGPPNSMMPPNGPMMPPNMMPQNGNMPFMGPRPPFGPNGPNSNNGNGPPNMPFMPSNAISETKSAESTGPSNEPTLLKNIQPPLPLMNIPRPKDSEPGTTLESENKVLSADGAVRRAAAEVASKGDHWENVLKAISSQDHTLWFLHDTNSNEYKAYRQLLIKIRSEGKPEVKPEDKYEPEFSLEDDDSFDGQSYVKEESTSERKPDANAQFYQRRVKREQASSQSDDEGDYKKDSRKKKKKSRWSDEPPPSDLKPPGVIAPLLPGVVAPLPPALAAGKGLKLAKIDEEGLKLTNVNRNNPALMQYAMTNYGTTNLSVEDWKKCEDNFKLNLLYQDMMKKRQEVERLAMAGKHKYEYDSDEDTSDGTWEHRLRAKEMCATEKWADELTKQAAGKHHIGDFLPPEELKKFMEKYSSLKGGKEPDLSDYKEFKLKEDNVGFKMLQKLGWSEGQGLGSEGTGIVDPINKSNMPSANLGLGAAAADAVCPDDDEFDAYRKRMMLAYRFRPNPLNNPRRPYY